MESSVTGPPWVPKWTARGTRETLAATPALGGLNIRSPGWYDTEEGTALVSDPMTGDDGSETVLATVWAEDPRPGLMALLELPPQMKRLEPEFIENWPRLVELSRSIAGKGAPSRELPERPPATARPCGDPADGGHIHVAGFQLAILRMEQDMIDELRSREIRLSPTCELVFLKDGVIALDRD